MMRDKKKDTNIHAYTHRQMQKRACAAKMNDGARAEGHILHMA